MRTRSTAIASDPAAEVAAVDLLLAGSSAVGAVVGGFFAASGSHGGVLLGPISILVAGIGVGARAFDGRARQPGLGTKRPRGFTAGEVVPAAASVAVTSGVAAALVANAKDGGTSLGSLLRAGIAQGQRTGATVRTELLRRIRSVGAMAMQEAGFVRPLLRVAGLSEGGLLTAQDFNAIPEVDQAARETPLDVGTLIEVPWAEEDQLSGATTDALGVGCAVLAVDVRGVFAALAYRRITDGVVIEELELEAPRIAVPVRRGVVRVRPGTPLPAPAPIAFRCDADGRLVEAMAAPGAPKVDLDRASLRLVRDPTTGRIEIFRS
ncbi:MAG: hypothetical protein JW751_30215 [Polyangiaceae bacterium]|nr:hypothetical protein [Polyangiaceae bacterium]